MDTALQKAAKAALNIEKYQNEAKERQRWSKGRGIKGRNSKLKSKGKATELAAKDYKVSARNIEIMLRIKKEHPQHPQLLQEVAEGTLTAKSLDCKIHGEEIGDKFYLIQLVPELNEFRLKMGKTNCVGRRLCEFKTTCPTAKVLKYWMCNAKRERAIIQASTFDCIAISDEIFDIQISVNEFVKRIDEIIKEKE